MSNTCDYSWECRNGSASLIFDGKIVVRVQPNGKWWVYCGGKVIAWNEARDFETAGKAAVIVFKDVYHYADGPNPLVFPFPAKHDELDLWWERYGDSSLMLWSRNDKGRVILLGKIWSMREKGKIIENEWWVYDKTGPIVGQGCDASFTEAHAAMVGSVRILHNPRFIPYLPEDKNLYASCVPTQTEPCWACTQQASLTGTSLVEQDNLRLNKTVTELQAALAYDKEVIRCLRRTPAGASLTGTSLKEKIQWVIKGNSLGFYSDTESITKIHSLLSEDK